MAAFTTCVAVRAHAARLLTDGALPPPTIITWRTAAVASIHSSGWMLRCSNDSCPHGCSASDPGWFYPACAGVPRLTHEQASSDDFVFTCAKCASS